MDLSVILISHRPKELAKAIYAFNQQSYKGISIELVVVQSVTDSNRAGFMALKYPPLAKVVQISPPHNNYYDNAAAARDFGLSQCCGQYVVFWDDDNLYYNHNLAAMFVIADGYDIGIARIDHTEYVIGDAIKPGRIDTMCVCVRRQIAVDNAWYDGGGGYNDYRWIKRCAEGATLNLSRIIVGAHL